MASQLNENLELRELPTQPQSYASTAEEGTAIRTQLGDELEQANGQSLAPTDGGKAAWRLLCTAFVFEALLWGFPLSFGVFQK
jgi:hypothetical protein